MVTLCIPYANGVDEHGVDEQLIGKYWGCACVNLMLTRDINIVNKIMKFF